MMSAVQRAHGDVHCRSRKCSALCAWRLTVTYGSGAPKCAVCIPAVVSFSLHEHSRGMPQAYGTASKEVVAAGDLAGDPLSC